MACIVATRSGVARLRRIAYRRPVAGLRIVDNPKKDRYEARDGRQVLGFSTYRRVGDRIVFIHTETDPLVKGRGVATHLAAGALDDVRARGLKVTPKCPFIAAYIRRHPAYQDLVVGIDELRQRRSAG
ncbi:MAG: N-acetyltransferase [Chloroflexi bacterium]|nr:MAG: N-acetyltransferase [Chloroflexota bacterium]